MFNSCKKYKKGFIPDRQWKIKTPQVGVGVKSRRSPLKIIGQDEPMTSRRASTTSSTLCQRLKVFGPSSCPLKLPTAFSWVAAGQCRQVVSRAPRPRTSGVLPRPAGPALPQPSPWHLRLVRGSLHCPLFWWCFMRPCRVPPWPQTLPGAVGPSRHHGASTQPTTSKGSNLPQCFWLPGLPLGGLRSGHARSVGVELLGGRGDLSTIGRSDSADAVVSRAAGLEKLPTPGLLPRAPR